jgi:hypothetical protein
LSGCTDDQERICDVAIKRKKLIVKDCSIMDRACSSKEKGCDISIVRQITPANIKCYDFNIPGGCWLRTVEKVGYYISRDSTLKIFDRLSHKELIELRNSIMEAGIKPNSPVYADLNLAKYFSPAP